jgi:hypothetical protein
MSNCEGCGAPPEPGKCSYCGRHRTPPKPKPRPVTSSGNVGTYLYDSYSAPNDREDLVDLIANIDPWDTPFTLKD